MPKKGVVFKSLSFKDQYIQSKLVEAGEGTGQQALHILTASITSSHPSGVSVGHDRAWDMRQEVYFLFPLLEITKSLYYRSENSRPDFCLLIFS